MDFYALLGVSRTATVAEIERAYRRLARRYHPGVNPGDRVSEAMYERIRQAYAVLADSGQRREYDLGPAEHRASAEPGVAFAGFDFSAPAEGPLAATFAELFADVFQNAAREAATPTRGADIALDITVSFRDAAEGAEMPVSVTRQERCPTCLGHGRRMRSPATCSQCGGSGTRRWARGHLVFTKTCEACAGEGRLDSEPCRTCAGVGTAARSEVVTVMVPAGIESRARIAVPCRGHAGARGGPAGDLYVTVNVAEHPYFLRDGPDLHITLPIAVHEAALGARVEVPTLDGPVRLRIAPGTASGQALRVRGHGIGPRDADADRRGDLVVHVQLVLPPDLDEPSKALLREFGRLNSGDVRRALFDQI